MPISKITTRGFNFANTLSRGDFTDTSFGDIVLLENEDGALKLESGHYLIGEGYNMATQSKDFADNSTFESDAGFGTTSTADDILDFTERNPFGEVDF